MGQNFVSFEHEVFEVLNAFPIVESFFEKMNINIKNVVEGISLKDFLKSNGFTDEESIAILRKLNQEILLFLNSRTEQINC